MLIIAVFCNGPFWRDFLCHVAEAVILIFCNQFHRVFMFCQISKSVITVLLDFLKWRNLFNFSVQFIVFIGCAISISISLGNKIIICIISKRYLCTISIHRFDNIPISIIFESSGCTQRVYLCDYTVFFIISILINGFLFFCHRKLVASFVINISNSMTFRIGNCSNPVHHIILISSNTSVCLR